jgi:hypothetical protein
MLVVEVDVFDAKTCKGFITAGFYVFGASTDVEAIIITTETNKLD